MADYAKCTIKFSFFVNDDDDFTELRNEIMSLLLKHRKILTATFHAQVGYEVVASYDDAADSDPGDETLA